MTSRPRAGVDGLETNLFGSSRRTVSRGTEGVGRLYFAGSLGRATTVSVRGFGGCVDSGVVLCLRPSHFASVDFLPVLELLSADFDESAGDDALLSPSPDRASRFRTQLPTE